MVENNFGEGAQEFYWEDDLYQLNQNEADDYRHELDYRNDREPLPQFTLGEYRIVMEQLSVILENLDGHQGMDTLLTGVLESLCQAGYREYEAMYGEEYSAEVDERINALINGVMADAINMLRSFGGGQ